MKEKKVFIAWLVVISAAVSFLGGSLYVLWSWGALVATFQCVAVFGLCVGGFWLIAWAFNTIQESVKEGEK